MGNMTLDGICLINETAGRIFYVNERLNEMFGYEPGEIVSANNIFAPFPSIFDHSLQNDIGYHVAKFGSWSGESLYLKKDGDEIWCHTHITTFEHPSYGTVWKVIHTDITRLKTLERELSALKVNSGEK